MVTTTDNKMAEKIFVIGSADVQSDKYFEEVYKTFFDRLFAYALVITKSESTAKDVVADVFYGLWNSKKIYIRLRNLNPTSK